MKMRDAILRLCHSRVGGLAAPAAWTAYMTATRRPCVVRREGDRWVHHHRSGVVISPAPGGPSPAQQEATTRDVYLWGFGLAPGATIIDLGAGIGTEVGTFSRLAGPDGRVIAAEAHPVTFAYLADNIRANGWSNVEAVHVAANDLSGSVTISNDLEAHIGNSIVTGSGCGLDVPAQTLDRLVRAHEVGTVDLLKLNIEGAEVAALRGAAETLRDTRQVYVSCHDFKADRTGDDFLRTREQVISLLTDAGFHLAFRTEDHRPWVADAVYATRRT